MTVQRIKRKIKKLTKKQKAELKKKILKKKKALAKKKHPKKKKHTQIIVREKTDKYSRSMSTLVADSESQLQLEEIQGQIVDKLAYSFEGKGVKVEGLTFWGMKACAEYDKKNKWKPIWTEPKYDVMPGDTVLLTIGCKNPKTKMTEWGNCIFSPNSRFAERIALTNAKRYALDKHISIPQKISFVQFLLSHKPKQILKINKTSKSKSGAGFTVSDTGKVKSKEGETINL